MDNGDILLHVIVRMDNATLRKLASVRLWDRVKLLLDGYFWYLRSEFVAGRSLARGDGLDWKRIYYALLYANSDRETFDWNNLRPRHLTGGIESGIAQSLSYLPSLLLLEGMYGPPDWSGWTQQVVWRAAQSTEVIDHLLSKGRLELSLSGSLEGLRSATARGDATIARHIMSLLDPIMDRGEINTVELLEGVMARAIHHDRLELVKFYDEQGLFSDRMLSVAVSAGTGEILRYLIETHKPDKKRLTGLIRSTRDNDGAGTLKVLLEYGANPSRLVRDWNTLISEDLAEIVSLLVREGIVEMSTRDWEDMLRRAVAMDSDKIVTLAFQHLGPSPIRDRKSLVGQLRSAGGPLANDIVFDAIRKAPSLTETLYSVDSNSDLVRSLTDSSDIGSWDVETLRVFSWAMRLATGLQARGFWNGQERVSERSQDSALSTMMEDGDIRSEILIYLLFKKPSDIELVDWMVERRDPNIAAAARSIVSGLSPASDDARTVSLRALMLCMLYPTLTLDELVETLRAEQLEGEDLTLCAGFVGAYLSTQHSRWRATR